MRSQFQAEDFGDWGGFCWYVHSKSYLFFCLYILDVVEFDLPYFVIVFFLFFIPDVLVRPIFFLFSCLFYCYAQTHWIAATAGVSNA